MGKGVNGIRRYPFPTVFPLSPGVCFLLPLPLPCFHLAFFVGENEKLGTETYKYKVV